MKINFLVIGDQFQLLNNLTFYNFFLVRTVEIYLMQIN